MEDNLYLAIIRFGVDKLEEGVPFEELHRHLEKLGYEVDRAYLLRQYAFEYDVVAPINSVGGGTSSSNK